MTGQPRVNSNDGIHSHQLEQWSLLAVLLIPLTFAFAWSHNLSSPQSYMCVCVCVCVCPVHVHVSLITLVMMANTTNYCINSGTISCALTDCLFLLLFRPILLIHRCWSRGESKWASLSLLMLPPLLLLASKHTIHLLSMNASCYS